MLSFVTRGLSQPIAIDLDTTALQDDLEASVQLTRLPESEVVGKVRLGFVSHAGDFAVRVAEAVDQASSRQSISQVEFTGILDDGMAQSVATRWLVEGAAGRDLIAMELPPSRVDVAPGTMVRVAEVDYRVDRVEVAQTRQVEASRVERSIYLLRDMQVDLPEWKGATTTVPVQAVWMDIPAPGGGVQGTPHLAVAARPWSGTVGIWKGLEDADYGLIGTVEQTSTLGITQTDLPAGQIGLINSKPVLRVRMTTGALASVPGLSVLGGANIAAIGDGSKDNWEIIQFTTATLVAPDLYELAGLLRGQLGTDAVMPEIWPAGSVFVVLDTTVGTVDLASDQRNVEQDYRIGLAAKGPGHHDATLHRLAFAGHGLRPYAVCHLRQSREANGGVQVAWIRRTRLGGDAWEPLDVPVSEEREAYQIRVRSSAGQTVRTVTTTVPAFVYSLADQLADGVSGTVWVDVAQISASYGLGPWRSLAVAI